MEIFHLTLSIMCCCILSPLLFLYNWIQYHVQEPQVFIRISHPLRSDPGFLCSASLIRPIFSFRWVMSPRGLKAILQHEAGPILIQQFLNSMKIKVLGPNLCLQLCFKLFSYDVLFFSLPGSKIKWSTFMPVLSFSSICQKQI